MSLLRRGIIQSKIAFVLSKVFGIDLYVGTGAPLSITGTGRDYVDKGGMLWIKGRPFATNHVLVDTERGATKYLESNSSNAEVTSANFVASLDSDGFTLGLDNDVNGGASRNFVAWQFLNESGFFDIVSYTGDGIAGRTIAHNLGETFGMCLIKRLSTSSSWLVQHKELLATEHLVLDNDAAKFVGSTQWDSTLADSTEITLGSNSQVNFNGSPFVAYVFAHNPSKGIFCGSYTGTGAAGNKTVTGFPVGWLLVKRTDIADTWAMYDISRGTSMLMDKELLANVTNAESTFNVGTFDVDGFTNNSVRSNMNAAGGSYIFMAIADPSAF